MKYKLAVLFDVVLLLYLQFVLCRVFVFMFLCGTTLIVCTSKFSVDNAFTKSFNLHLFNSNTS